MEKSLFTALKSLKEVLKIMNNIKLLDLLKTLYKDELVRIYMERPHKSEGYRYLTTRTAYDILEDEEDEYLLDSDIRVTTITIAYDCDYGCKVLEIVVKEIPNESE